MLRAALRLAEKGCAVFPCVPRQKIPATPHGCLDATHDPLQIQDWWHHEPQFNIGIATGTISNLFVIDVDGLDAEAELKKLEAQHGGLPQSIEVITARGRHIYFKAPEKPVRNSASKIAPGIDTRGDGGYVLAPPSVHPSGRPYCWSVDSANTFANAPAWLLDKITDANTGTATPPSEWRNLIKGVGEGARDCTVAKVAGYLLRRHVGASVALELLQGWNVRSCRPSLPESDIVRIVNSIASRELKRRLGNE
jgi:Bifunctional DNA primase/polymerase, N-terminal/Primase C terminal 1 (PriCT-1)